MSFVHYVARHIFQIFVWTLVAFSFRSVWADSSPLLKSIDADQAAFEAHARAEERITLAEYYDANRPAKANTEKLTRAIERAQSAWLSGAVDQARAGFRDVAALALDDDWQEAHRETIAYAMMRLAQSAPTPLEVSEWIERVAVTFPSYRPDDDLFPPPLLNTYRETQARQRTLAKEIPLETLFRGYRFVLINGQKFRPQAKKSIRLSSGTYRVTAFSDSNAPITEKMTLAQLSSYRAASPPLVIGNCQAPQFFQVPQVTGAVSAYFGNQCVRTNGEPLKPLADYTTLTSPQTPLPTEPPSKSFLGVSKTGWVVVGLTAVAVSAAIAIDRASKPKVEPTIRNGF